jgi:hypothetical protein
MALEKRYSSLNREYTINNNAEPLSTPVKTFLKEVGMEKAPLKNWERR